MDTALQLYPAQQEGVRRFLESPTYRMVLAYGTGVGKTPTAIRCLVELWKARRVQEAPRFLIVCPAIVRRHWQREFYRWAQLEALPIEMGRLRASGTKAALAARDLAYASDIQVVSYDLLGNIELDGWDGVVLDEVHHLSDCASKQSRLVHGLLLNNPGVPVLALSATLIPTRVEQLWHPLYLLFGSKWGRRPRAGSICWDFASRYCELERSEYGTKVGRARDAMMGDLKGRLLKVCHRLTREDIADDLPPLDVRTLEVPGNTLARGLHVVGSALRKRPEIEHAVAWYRELPDDVTHAVILVYHRDVATQLANQIVGELKDGAACVRIDGTMPTDQRVKMLDIAERSPRAILIATSESIREGVRLMWAQKVLFAEWRQSPVKVTQTLGRFQSVGDRRRPQIEVLTDESLYGQAKVLTDRIKVITAALKGSNAERTVAEVFEPSDLSEERLEALTRDMLSQFNPVDSEWTDETEESDDGF